MGVDLKNALIAMIRAFQFPSIWRKCFGRE